MLLGIFFFNGSNYNFKEKYILYFFTYFVMSFKTNFGDFQVESRENPSLRGKPSAVVQYNSWKGGGIIAVNYEARAAGVTR